MSALYKACQADSAMDPVLISTGQHREMLDQAFDWFNLRPDEDLNIMKPNQTLSSVLSVSLTGLDALIAKHKPDVVLAQGDTATVLSAALAAFNREVPFGHVEAGLRTYDLSRPYPEEGYRQMVQRVTRWNFAPTQRAMDVLKREQVCGTAYLVGNTVIDALLETAKLDNPLPEALRPALTRARMVLITGHRRENLGQRMQDMFSALKTLAKNFPDVDYVYPVHLNPKVKDLAHDRLGGVANVHLIDPVPYPQMVALMQRAYLILTDSGGVQEEAPTFKVPVLVMRDTTERQDGVEAGVSKLVGADFDVIVSETTRLLTNDSAYQAMRQSDNPFGDGKSAARIVDILKSDLQ